MALLGSCRAARSVGAAASLTALRAVTLVDPCYVDEEPVVPLIRDLEPVQETLDSGVESKPRWLQRTSAVRGGVPRGAAASVLSSRDHTEKDRLPELRALLRRCPNVVSLRLCSGYDHHDVGPFLASELGALAPSLEVLDLSFALISNKEDLHAGKARWWWCCPTV